MEKQKAQENNILKWGENEEEKETANSELKLKAFLNPDVEPVTYLNCDNGSEINMSKTSVQKLPLLLLSSSPHALSWDSLFCLDCVIIRSSLVLKPALAPSPWLVQLGMAALQSVVPPASEDTVTTRWGPCRRTAAAWDPISPSRNCLSPVSKYIDHRGIALAGLANPCSHGNKERAHNG